MWKCIYLNTVDSKMKYWVLQEYFILLWFLLLIQTLLPTIRKTAIIIKISNVCINVVWLPVEEILFPLHHIISNIVIQLICPTEYLLIRYNHVIFLTIFQIKIPLPIKVETSPIYCKYTNITTKRFLNFIVIWNNKI